MERINISLLNRTLTGLSLADSEIQAAFLDNDFAVIHNLRRPQATGPWSNCQIDMAVFMLTLRGTCSLNVDQTEYRAEPDTLTILTPLQHVRLGATSDDYLCLIICISPQRVDDVLARLSEAVDIFLYAISHPVIRLTEAQAQWIFDYHRLLYRELSTERCGYARQIATGLFVSLFYKACDMLREQSAIRHTPTGRRQELFQRFMASLHAGFKSERSVAYYAKSLCVTPKYLSIVVRQVSGRPPRAWIDDMVIREAKEQLRDGGKSVQQIALGLNFCNQSFFGKYFKHHTGLSPLAYRNGIR